MTFKRFLTAYFGILVLFVIAVCLAKIPWLWHPLGYCPGPGAAARTACRSYNFWSGIESDLPEIGGLALATTALLAFYHQHNCHEAGCPWLIWHPHPEHGHPVCKKHHPHNPSDLSCSTDTSPTSAAS